MVQIKEVKIDGYKKVIEATDPGAHLHCMIAIHDTSLGPSLGGTRIYPYASSQEALEDVLLLAKAMTRKSAVAELGTGGGKSVILADPYQQKTEKLLLAFAEVVHSLQGDYIAAEDVGSDTKDMAIIRQKTPYVAALPTHTSSGDPSPFTAWGVYRGIQAVAQKLWGTPSVANKKILVQGLGQVGSKLANILFWEGAQLILCEANEARLEEHAAPMGAKTVGLYDYIHTECDIFAPCAMGGVITEEIVPHLKCKAIAGAANNQLASPLVGEMLLKKRILYAPDYVINAGGLINATAEFNAGGYNATAARDKVNHIYYLLLKLFDKAEKEDKPTTFVADEIAQYNLTNLIGQRKKPIDFKH
ncbi:Leucine dehydrogenase [Neochlamydia sp. TUME1]|uniref:Glu/Leu/Phe/Val dehydrogenase family protein n=1 Tax=Neochlamydia sp. TUME1 TaxID=1478174 RepID=UPI00057EC609|nr:Glu/Leu/Phe/Val dehydrogenase family protein [Neochlamydia sp. TUME1]KIC77124.1 Leucine dehydrogenase [Neochlamydia sp. TUME1]